MTYQQPGVKQKKKPNVPLKPFMWNTIPFNNVKGTIWEQINDEKVVLDIKFIEEQFEKPAPAPPTQKSGGAANGAIGTGVAASGGTTAPQKPVII